MRLLLDTHVLLWWGTDDPRLPGSWRPILTDPTHDVFVSSVSMAEIAIKASLGKLSAPRDLFGGLEEQGFAILSLSFDHAAQLWDLPWHHRDPFDRMLVAHARVEGLIVVTVDPAFAAYDIHVLQT
ncbi:MAG TPA: type II toxin-antitoxin system VapC family toxin [Propionibacteriaceae bacterium]|nr:type II toxin-antitoxin system VapC family toxin [Propionibacteriaceae bacterium]